MRSSGGPVLLLSLAAFACSGGAGPQATPTPQTGAHDSTAAGAGTGSAGRDSIAGEPGAAGTGRTRPASAGASGTPGSNSDASTASAAGASAQRPDSGLAPDAAEPPDAAPSADPAARWVTFRNGGFWNDAAGKRIEAHGGGFLQVGATWYWFGEDKSANNGNFKAVNCYASQDLSSWEFRKAIITRATAAELDAPDRIIERPKVIYNERTQKYVMWLHWEGRNYAEAEAGVFTSDTVDGDYTYVSSFRPNGNMSRDDTLFQDDDGKAYFVSAANENADLIVYELAPDYLTIARQVSTLFPGAYREAPALFKHAGRYYLITSGATGWDPNQAKYTTAMSMNGPWSALQNLGNASTFDSQSTYVIAVQGSQRTTYVYAGDRWQDPDLGSSKYIWLPLTLGDAGRLSLDYYPEWQLDLASGNVRVEDGFIPQTDWKLLRADSEESEAEDGRAQNAFDGSASTIWHTRYTGDKPSPPHEIQIDLGASYMLEALRYLPRQDSVDHGMVASYELYVAEAPDAWGPAAASGSLAGGREPKLIRFSARPGRYVRFVATREISDRAYTSVAELDMLGSRL